MKQKITLLLLLFAQILYGQFRMGFAYQHKARKTISFVIPAPAKLNLTADNIWPLTHIQGDLGQLVDNNIATALPPTYNSISDTTILHFNLLAVHTLQKVMIYHTLGTQQIKLEGRMTFSTSETPTVIYQGPISAYNSWVTYANTGTYRWITFTYLSPNSTFPPEIEIYGSPLSTLQSIAPVSFTADTLKGTQLGTNSYNWVTNETPRSMNWYRNYTEMKWVATTTGPFEDSLMFNRGQGDFNDYIMDSIKRKGFTQMLCIQDGPRHFNNVTSTTGDSRYRAHAYDADPYAPLSYLRYAKVITQYVYRYGSIPTVDSNLKLYSWTRSNGYFVQSRVSGLDLVKYYELGNEEDKWWEGMPGRYDAFQYAALLSMCWDGHEGLVPGVGMKVADPNSKLVAAGLAANNWKYYALMHQWFIDNRTDDRFCVDMINFHTYPSNGLDGQFSGDRAKSPEWYKFGSVCKEFVAHCKRFAPTIPVAISEWGFETNTSAQSPNDYSNALKYDVAAGWAFRTYLNFAKSGMGPIIWFNIYDNDGVKQTNTDTYVMSGLLDSNLVLKKTGRALNNLSTMLSNKTWTIAEDTAAHYYSMTNGTEKYEFYWNRSVTVNPEGGKTKKLINDVTVMPYAETSITSGTTYNLTSEIPIGIHTTTP